MGLFGICWGATGYSSLLSGWLCRDGVTVTFPYLPGGLDDFVEHVIPELQRRGLFQRDYEGTTLREHAAPAESLLSRLSASRGQRRYAHDDRSTFVSLFRDTREPLEPTDVEFPHFSKCALADRANYLDFDIVANGNDNSARYSEEI